MLCVVVVWCICVGVVCVLLLCVSVVVYCFPLLFGIGVALAVDDYHCVVWLFVVVGV